MAGTTLRREAPETRKETDETFDLSWIVREMVREISKLAVRPGRDASRERPRPE